MATAPKAAEQATTAAPTGEQAAQTPQAIAQPAPRKPIPSLSPERFKTAEYERQIHVANAGEATLPVDILYPNYWAHNAAQMKPWDRIEVRANDGTWFAELIVLDVSRQWAKVHCLNLHKFSDFDTSQTGAVTLNMPYIVTHKGPQLKWCVIRRVDNAIVHQESSSPEEAQQWMKERMKAG